MFSPYLVTAALPQAVRGAKIYPDSPIHDGPRVLTRATYLSLLSSYTNEKSKNRETLVQIKELETENKTLIEDRTRLTLLQAKQTTTIAALQEELAMYKSFY